MAWWGGRDPVPAGGRIRPPDGENTCGLTSAYFDDQLTTPGRLCPARDEPGCGRTDPAIWWAGDWSTLLSSTPSRSTTRRSGLRTDWWRNTRGCGFEERSG